jgi:hypothetical protein
MPSIVRFMLISFATGAALGWAFAGVLFWYDAHGLAELIRNSPHRWVIAAMLLASVGGMVGICFTATGLDFLGSGGFPATPGSVSSRSRRGARPRAAALTRRTDRRWPKSSSR